MCCCCRQNQSYWTSRFWVWHWLGREIAASFHFSYSWVLPLGAWDQSCAVMDLCLFSCWSLTVYMHVIVLKNSQVWSAIFSSDRSSLIKLSRRALSIKSDTFFCAFFHRGRAVLSLSCRASVSCTTRVQRSAHGMISSNFCFTSGLRLRVRVGRSITSFSASSVMVIDSFESKNGRFNVFFVWYVRVWKYRVINGVWPYGFRMVGVRWACWKKNRCIVPIVANRSISWLTVRSLNKTISKTVRSAVVLSMLTWWLHMMACWLLQWQMKMNSGLTLGAE